MVEVAAASVVAILTRAPRAGGKSRLFAALGRDPDPSLLEALLLDTIDGAYTARAVRIVAVEPADACDDVRALVPADVQVVAQSSGSIGDRMHAVMSDLLTAGASIVAVIGSDLPDIRGELLERAFELVARDQGSLVLGPSTDGGYYLIAAAHVPDVFTGIEWGTSRVLEQTCAAARDRALTVHLLPPLRDVDTVDDLEHVLAARTSAWCRAHARDIR